MFTIEEKRSEMIKGISGFSNEAEKIEAFIKEDLALLRNAKFYKPLASQSERFLDLYAEILDDCKMSSLIDMEGLENADDEVIEELYGYFLKAEACIEKTHDIRKNELNSLPGEKEKYGHFYLNSKVVKGFIDESNRKRMEMLCFLNGKGSLKDEFTILTIDKNSEISSRLKLLDLTKGQRAIIERQCTSIFMSLREVKDVSITNIVSSSVFTIANHYSVYKTCLDRLELVEKFVSEMENKYP